MKFLLAIAPPSNAISLKVLTAIMPKQLRHKNMIFFMEKIKGLNRHKGVRL